MPHVTAPSTHTAPATTSTPSHPGAPQAPLTPERVKTLLNAGPNWSAPARAPDRPRPSATEKEAEETKQLEDLDAALTPETIKEIQSNPNSPKSRMITEQFNRVLTPEKVRSMSRGGNAKKNRAVLRNICDKLDKKTIDSNLDSTKHQVISDATDKMRLKILQIIIASFEGDLWSAVEQHKSSLGELGDIRKRFSEMETQSKTLTDTAASLSDEQLDRADLETQASSNTDTTSDTYATYSFNATSESTLEAPSEIRSFKSGDKLDLSGIQRQLNTPLRQVERPPEASGEMQIHHSPSSNTSVIVIADAPGKPPFVVKVFGEVRQSNIVT